MRLSLTLCAVLLFVGSLAAGEQHEPQVDTQIDLSAVEAVVASAQSHVANLGLLIAAQDEKLNALYDQREAARHSNQGERVEHLNTVIDQMNLTLTNLEAERDGIAATIATLQDQIAVLRSHAENGIEE